MQDINTKKNLKLKCFLLFLNYNARFAFMFFFRGNSFNNLAKEEDFMFQFDPYNSGTGRRLSDSLCL